jgi:hypothetical protein
MGASPLAGWENFYVIVGSSAGGLTGITFVVVALIRDMAGTVRPTGLSAFVVSSSRSSRHLNGGPASHVRTRGTSTCCRRG